MCDVMLDAKLARSGDFFSSFLAPRFGRWSWRMAYGQGGPAMAVS